MAARRLTCFTLAIAVVAVAIVATAAASPALRPPAGSPDPRLMVLTPADLHVKAKRQHYFRDADFPSVISYEREFDGGRAYGAKLLGVESLAEIGVDAQTTARFVAAARRYYGSKQARADLRKSFAEATDDPDFLLSELRIGRIRSLGAGPGSFDLPMRVVVLGVKADVHFAVFRVDRALGALFVIGAPRARLPVSKVARIARLLGSRMTKELAPKSLSPPVVAGVPQVGQTLTASNGTWSGTPSTATRQWQRCDASGASCASIPGATGQAYVLTDADAGSTIRVLVTVRNAAGAARARSAPTAPVRPSAPANTALPTISGTAQVGQTLTATTGSWTGSPTSFGFQWQRCDASGYSCAAIPGATAGTYAVTEADRGSTLLVVVTATNAAGSGSAASAATPPVP